MQRIQSAGLGRALAVFYFKDRLLLLVKADKPEYSLYLYDSSFSVPIKIGLQCPNLVNVIL